MKRPLNSWGDYKWWIVPAIIAIVVIWIIRLLIAQSPTPVAVVRAPLRTVGAPTATPTPNVSTVGPNLLINSNFEHLGANWDVYHNAKPMGVLFLKSAGSVQIKINNVKNGVQEVYQVLKTTEDHAVVVSGAITIAGDRLPRAASAEVLVIDSSNTPHLASVFGFDNGTIGRHPFVAVISPKGHAKQLVLIVLTGPSSSNSTTVAFENLKVAFQGPR